MRFFNELKRRNVFRVAGVYAVVGWLIIQIVVAIKTPLSLPSWTDSLIIVFLCVGFPVALVLAWAIEITPEGVKLTKNAAEGERAAVKTDKWLDYAILAGLALVAVLVVAERTTRPSTYEQFAQTPDAEGGPGPAAVSENAMDPQFRALAVGRSKSIAVLPFANRSPDPNDAFFTEGVHDDLLAQLSKMGDMRVISRTSVSRYVGANKAIPDIASELRVAAVMEGAVQRVGNRVRITVQLIDGETDEHLWAEAYDRELTTENIFDIQSEITRAIAVALNAFLSPEDEATIAARPTQSLTAYEAFLKGKEARRKSLEIENPEDQAVSTYQIAVAEDPNFAAAHAALAEALLGKYWFGSRYDRTWIDKARASLERAQALAPQSVATLVAWGYYYYWGFLDYDKAADFIDRALAKAPNEASVWLLKGLVARRAGRFEEAVRAFRIVNELDPLSRVDLRETIKTLSLLGRYAEAQDVLDRMKAVDPENRTNIFEQIYFWFDEGNAERACSELDAYTPSPDSEESYYDAELTCGYFLRDGARVDNALAKAPPESFDWPGYPENREFAKARVFAGLGREEEAQRIATEIAARLAVAESPYPAGWTSRAAFTPAAIAGLLRDLDGLRAAAQDFEQNAPADAFEHIQAYLSLAGWFTRAGDADTAFMYLDRVTRSIGPARFPLISIDPVYDGIRDDPRYQAMRMEYEAWAAGNGNAN